MATLPMRLCSVAFLSGLVSSFSLASSRLSTSVSIRLTKKRSEEHTSELQSLAYLVCRLLLEKKNKELLWYHVGYVAGDHAGWHQRGEDRVRHLNVLRTGPCAAPSLFVLHFGPPLQRYGVLVY